MDECHRLNACPLVNSVFMQDPELKARYERHYCRGDFTRCARVMAYELVGAGEVPVDILPDQHRKVRDLLDRRGSGEQDS